MALTKSQKEFLELIQDAETMLELKAVAAQMKPEDRAVLAFDIHKATERIVKLTKGL